ncbi:MAG: FtsH protease activity modulator HflK [Pseudomonadota bacterium]
MSNNQDWFSRERRDFPDFNNLENKVKDYFSKSRWWKYKGKLIYVVIALLVGAWFLSGIYVVNPGELGVVRQFGQEVAQTMPGLQYHWPFPIQRKDIVNIEEIRRIEVGFRSVEKHGEQSITDRHLEESLMVTGDENIADIQMLVQYRVKSASDFLFKVRDPEMALKKASEVALRGVIGKTEIDEAMTTGRSRVEADTLKFLQKLLDDYKTGLYVIEVKLLVVDPPDLVKDAFHEVVRAMEDKTRLIREAEGYREDIVPKARGDAQKMIKNAEAYKEKRTKEAEGDASKFDQVFAEYEKARSITRERLYLETVQRILDDVEKIIISSGVSKAGLQKLLPIKKFATIEGAGQ